MTRRLSHGTTHHRLQHAEDLSAILTLPLPPFWWLNVYSGSPCGQLRGLSIRFLPWWTFRYAARIKTVSANGHGRLMSVLKAHPGGGNCTSGDWFHRTEGLRWRRMESQKARQRATSYMSKTASCGWCKNTWNHLCRPVAEQCDGRRGVPRINPADPPKNQFSGGGRRLWHPVVSRWTTA